MIEPSDLFVNSIVSPSCWPNQKTGCLTEVARLWRSAGETAFPLPELVLRSASQRMSPAATAIAMTAPVRKRIVRAGARDAV